MVNRECQIGPQGPLATRRVQEAQRKYSNLMSTAEAHELKGSAQVYLKTGLVLTNLAFLWQREKEINMPSAVESPE